MDMVLVGVNEEEEVGGVVVQGGVSDGNLHAEC